MDQSRRPSDPAPLTRLLSLPPRHHAQRVAATDREPGPHGTRGEYAPHRYCLCTTMISRRGGFCALTPRVRPRKRRCPHVWRPSQPDQVWRRVASRSAAKGRQVPSARSAFCGRSHRTALGKMRKRTGSQSTSNHASMGTLVLKRARR